MISSMVSQLLLVAFAGLMVWAAVSDGRAYIIPNRIPAAVAGLWVADAASRVLAGAPGSEVLIALALGLGAFAVGTVLFAFRLVGGGDVKLLASAMLWAGPALALPFVLITLLAGGILGIAVLAARMAYDFTATAALGGPALRLRVVFSNALKSHIPFGMAIAAGGLFVAHRLLFGL